MDNVFVMENHNEALAYWRRLGVKDKTLVHIDSHFDFAWITDSDPQALLSLKSLEGFKKNSLMNPLWNLSGRAKEELVHIGNYIEPAIKEGIVGEFFWVVPDFFCSTKIRLRRLKNQIRDSLLRNPGFNTKVVTENNCLKAKIGKVNLTVCSLEALPRIESDALLDIDVDYFVNGNALWLHPDTFARILKQKVPRGLVTIAYSVEGGFTPIEYKFIGDYLLALFDDSLSDTAQYRQAMDSLIKAAEAKKNKALLEAESFLKEAFVLCPDSAAIQYHFSMLYYALGLKRPARDYYWQAVSKDGSYRTLYNNRGPVLEENSRLHSARREYEKMLELDPENFHYYARLGNIFSQKKDWGRALENYAAALRLHPRSHEAYAGRGYVFLKQKRLDEAIESFTQSLTLNPHNPYANYWIGAAYMNMKQYTQAMRSIRCALNNGFFTLPQARWRLVFIYWKNKVYNRMCDEIKYACIASYYDSIKRIA